MKIKLNSNRLEEKGKCHKLNLKEINTSTFVMESSLDKYLFQLMMQYEETLQRKLNILILGSNNHNLGIELAGSGHKITFITWDIDDHRDLEILINKSQFSNEISNKFMKLSAFGNLAETKYDILLCLMPMHRLLSDLNLIKQETFFKYVLKNIESAFWILPRNDESNPLNMYFTQHQYLDFYTKYSYIREVTRVKIIKSGSAYPLVYTSNTLAFIDNNFYSNNNLEIYQNSGSLFSRIYLYKNKLRKVTLTDNNGNSGTFEEYNFMNNLSKWNRIKLRIPLGVSLDKGIMFDSFGRSKLDGIDLIKIKNDNNSDKILTSFVKLSRRYSKANIYHNDLRPWNVLWNGRNCVFIDFENSSTIDRDVSGFPQILYFFSVANFIKQPYRQRIWNMEHIIQQNGSYLLGYNEVQKLICTPWEKISRVSVKELLAVDYCDVKKGFKELIELLESH